MKLGHIIQKVYFDPVMMTPTLHATIRSIVERHLEDDYDMPEDGDDSDFFGNKIPKPYNVAGVSVIPVYGTIAHKVGRMEKACGVVDVKDIKNWYTQALNDPAVTGIVFDIDSGGGFVTGVPELAQYIRNNNDKKPTVAFTDSMMASAAHYIGAGTSAIFSTQTADVGSIGVYSYICDVSRLYEKEGVKVELFSDGKYKGMGIQGLSLTSEQKAYLQSEVEEMGKEFKSFMRVGRKLDDETLQGQTFNGPKGVQVGLIDGVVDGLENVIAYFKSV
jgi:signal peptide peptidase SppA